MTEEDDAPSIVARGDSMTKFFAIAFTLGLGIATLSAAQAAGGCGRGFHRGWHGHCVRNHRVVFVPPPPPMMAPPPVRTQTITAPARTGIIPGSGNSANSVCAYGFHPGPNGDCRPN
jgi:hypothetical protein